MWEDLRNYKETKRSIVKTIFKRTIRVLKSQLKE